MFKNIDSLIVVNKILLIFGVVVLVGVGFVGYSKYKPQTSDINSVNSSYPSKQETSRDFVYMGGDKWLSDAKKYSQETSMGQITGKLCFGSSFVPMGVIVARHIPTGRSSFLAHNGPSGDSTYTMSLKPGSYHVRFDGYYEDSADGQPWIGYYSDKDGTLLEVNVQANKTTPNIDLCGGRSKRGVRF